MAGAAPRVRAAIAFSFVAQAAVLVMTGAQLDATVESTIATFGPS
jgi:hypothetical protein